ncbi:MAG TPA: hypothetical protein VMR95_00505 [Candidatus Binatia bacterium]|nr:hypothetical protein [Candidatus Binatia bacterium]
MSAESVQTDVVHQNAESNVPEADQLTTNPDTRQSSGLLQRLARPAVMLTLLPAAFGSASPAMAAASGAHEAAAHKKPNPVAETPVQKALKSDLVNFAAQIITDYNKAKTNPQNQGLAYDASCGALTTGNESFCVTVPVLDTVDGVTETPAQSYGGHNTADGYTIGVSLDYPNKLLNNPPNTPDPNYVSEVAVGQDTAFYYPGNGSPSPFLQGGPSYAFSAVLGNSTTNTWDMCQYIESPNETSMSGIDPAPLIDTMYYWAYATAPSQTKCDRTDSSTKATPFTMAELQSEAGVVQTMLNNVPPQAETLVSLASLPAPTSTMHY